MTRLLVFLRRHVPESHAPGRLRAAPCGASATLLASRMRMLMRMLAPEPDLAAARHRSTQTNTCLSRALRIRCGIMEAL